MKITLSRNQLLILKIHLEALIGMMEGTSDKRILESILKRLNKEAIKIAKIGWANARLIAKAPEMEAEIECLKQINADLLNILKQAEMHLEYCNYGDKWEKECAYEEKLPERISEAIAKAESKGDDFDPNEGREC